MSFPFHVSTRMTSNTLSYSVMDLSSSFSRKEKLRLRTPKHVSLKNVATTVI